MNLQRYIKPFLFTFAIILGMFGASIVIAWTGPTQTPPNCTSGNPGCDAPLNISSSNQIKTGSITANGLSASSAIVAGTTIWSPQYCFAGGTNCISSWPSGSSQWTTSGTNIYNANSGNVGIGNTNPQTKLDVTGGIRQSGSTALRIENTFGSVPTGSSGIGLELGQISGLGFIQSYDRTNSVYSQLYMDESAFVVRPNGSPKLYVTTTGVGVGGSPNYNFDVTTGTASTWSAHIANTNVTTSYGLYIQAGNNASDYPFYINNSSGGTNLAYINGAGTAHFAGDVCTSSGHCLNSTTSGGGLTTSNDYIFGGAYSTYTSNGACEVTNPLTGGCSCPTGAINTVPRWFSTFNTNNSGSPGGQLFFCSN